MVGAREGASKRPDCVSLRWICMLKEICWMMMLFR